MRQSGLVSSASPSTSAVPSSSTFAFAQSRHRLLNTSLAQSDFIISPLAMEHELHNAAHLFVSGMPVNDQSMQPALDGDVEVASCYPASIYYTPPDSPVGPTPLSIIVEPSVDIEAKGFLHDFLADRSENPEQTSIGSAVLNTPAITPRTRTLSSSSAETVVQCLGVFDLYISELCKFIQRRQSLQQAIITMTEGYAERSGVILHRFLVLELKREDKKPIYLRLDRRLGEGVSRMTLLRASGVTSANDTARFAASKDRLIGNAEQENQQVFKAPLTLDKMRHILLITCDELRTYKLCSENCWFFVSLLQQILEEAGEGHFVLGCLMSPKLAPGIRERVKTRLQSHSIYRPPRTADDVKGNSSSRLVISIDIGRVDAAVAIAYFPLDGWDPASLSLARVPTEVVYSNTGRLLACGAEAAAVRGKFMQRESERFGMRLHRVCDSGTEKVLACKIADPPLSVMLADYLRYLLRGTQAFLRQRTGCDIWENLTKPPEVIFSHSNRWGAGPQQIFKKAAIQAELVAKGNLECLRFVGKAHAITSFTLFPTLSLNCGALFKNGTKFVICDAGGSTVDISTYVTNRTDRGGEVEELDVPSCLDAGSIHVDKELCLHLYEQLFTEPDLRELDVEDMHEMVDDGLADFRGDGKLKFSSPTDHLEVKIGGPMMNYPRIQISRGVMRIESSKANLFFRDYVEQSVDEITRRVEKHQTSIIVLAGEFAESPYFQRVLHDRVSGRGRSIMVANHPTSKVAAEGALRLVVDGMVVVRKRKPRKLWPVNFRTGLRPL